MLNDGTYYTTIGETPLRYYKEAYGFSADNVYPKPSDEVPFLKDVAQLEGLPFTLRRYIWELASECKPRDNTMRFSETRKDDKMEMYYLLRSR